MDEMNISEDMHLINYLSDDTNYIEEHKTNNLATGEVKLDDQKLLNLKESAFVMLGITLGSGTLLQPFLIRQLGILGWFGCLILTMSSCSLTATLLAKSTARVLDENDTGSLVRDPYQLVTEKSCGRNMRLVLVLLTYFTLLTNCMSMLLLSSSILSNLIPIPHINDIDTVRVWSTVLVGVLTPITYLGTYAELRLPALLSVTTGVSSVSLILVNSLLYRFVFEKPGDFNQTKIQNADQIFFIPLGTVLFSAGGAGIAPNIVSVSTSRSQIHKSFIGAFSCAFVGLIVSGIAPYLVFGDFARSNTVSTFHSVINNGGREHDQIRAFIVITTLIDVIMMLDTCTSIVLLMNPLFLHMEKMVGIPHGKLIFLII